MSFSIRAQDAPKNYKSKIFIGYWNSFDPYDPLFMIGYTFVNKLDDRVRTSLTCFDLRKNAGELLLTLSYDVPLFGNPNGFDILLSGQLHGFYRWSHTNPNIDYWKSGPFIGLGLIPTYRISRRVDISYELIGGYGYLWSTKVSLPSHYYYTEEKVCIDCGSYFLLYNVFRFGYWF